jgi:hypothetical protein
MHVAQCGLDPSLYGGEVAVQKAYDGFANMFDLDKNLEKDLRPSSLLQMIGLMKEATPEDHVRYMATQAYFAMYDSRDRKLISAPELDKANDLFTKINKSDYGDDLDTLVADMQTLSASAVDFVEKRQLEVMNDLYERYDLSRTGRSAEELIRDIKDPKKRFEIENINGRFRSGHIRADLQQFYDPLARQRQKLETQSKALDVILNSPETSQPTAQMHEAPVAEPS